MLYARDSREFKCVQGTCILLGRVCIFKLGLFRSQYRLTHNNVHFNDNPFLLSAHMYNTTSLARGWWKEHSKVVKGLSYNNDECLWSAFRTDSRYIFNNCRLSSRKHEKVLVSIFKRTLFFFQTVNRPKKYKEQTRSA